MTVGDKVHQALTTAESLKAQLEMFGHDTQDQFAKAEFYRMAQTMEQQVIPSLKGRCNYMEQQEPQFKVKQQAQQQQTNG
jgi:hypothetical protein